MFLFQVLNEEMSKARIISLLVDYLFKALISLSMKADELNLQTWFKSVYIPKLFFVLLNTFPQLKPFEINFSIYDKQCQNPLKT